MKIPLVDLKANYNSIKEEIDSAIHEVIDKTAFVGGPFLEKFEEEFARKIGAKYCIGCSSGTTAIQLALLAHNANNSAVVTVPNTFIATAEAVEATNGWPIFCDVLETGMMNISSSIECIKDKNCDNIIPVHLFGSVVDVDILKEKLPNVTIIEDAAQAHFARYNDGKFVGSKNTTCYSFFPGKNMGSFGDAGAVTTNDTEIYEYIKAYRDHGRKTKFESDFIGNNFRMDAIQAAILSVKLKYIEQWNARRRDIARFYDQKLSDIQQLKIRHKMFWDDSKYENQVFHLYVVLSKKRNELKKFLEGEGISCGIHYPVPIHKQKAFKKMYEGHVFPIAEKLSEQMLSLPIFPEMSNEQVEYVCSKIKEFFE